MLHISSPGRGMEESSHVSPFSLVPGGGMSCLEALIILIMYCLPHMWPIDEGKHKLGAAAEADDSSHIRSLQLVFWQPGKGTCFALIMSTVSYIARESFITLVSILALQVT